MKILIKENYFLKQETKMSMKRVNSQVSLPLHWQNKISHHNMKILKAMKFFLLENFHYQISKFTIFLVL